MRNAGYTLYTSKLPKFLTQSKGFKEMATPMIEQLNTERERLINEMQSRKLTKEEYRTLVSSFDTLTKNVQLLTGRPTEIVKNDLSELSNEELDRIAKEGESDDGQEGEKQEKSSSVYPA